MTSLSIEEIDKELVRAWQPIMQGTPPIVFINGKAKANPTLQEVVAEFHAAGEGE